MPRNKPGPGPVPKEASWGEIFQIFWIDIRSSDQEDLMVFQARNGPYRWWFWPLKTGLGGVRAPVIEVLGKHNVDVSYFQKFPTRRDWWPMAGSIGYRRLSKEEWPNLRPNGRDSLEKREDEFLKDSVVWQIWSKSKIQQIYRPTKKVYI